VKLRPATLSLFLGSFAFYFAAPEASAGDVIQLDQEHVVFHTTSFNDYPGVCADGTYHTVTGPNYSVQDRPYFDGMIAPISYPSGSENQLYFNLSFGFRNYRITSTLHGMDENAYFDDASLHCAPTFQAGMSAADDAFTWEEWLYGTFRDVATGTSYALIYNEYYGGDYYTDSPRDGSSNYNALGLAVSTNNGATFSRLQSAYGHIFARSPNLRINTLRREDTQGISSFGGIFKSPLDQMYYVGMNVEFNAVQPMGTGAGLIPP
jgi:hypothetical protein